MTLLNGETTTSTGIMGLELTNYRIRYTADNHLDSMLISEIASMHIGYKNNKWWLFLAFFGLFMFLGAYNIRSENILMFSVLLIILGIILYLNSRIRKLSIVSRGNTAIAIKLQNVNQNLIVDLIEKVEAIKLERLVVSEEENI